MKQIEMVAPEAGLLTPEEFGDRLRQSLQHKPKPFSDDALDFCGAFSSRIFADAEARSLPELHALAFFMRRAHLMELKQRFSAYESTDTRITGRGVIFHIPPRNVSSILVYSWLMAAITGNINIVRVPLSPSEATRTLIRLYTNLIKTWPSPFRLSTFMIRFDHDDAITALISSLADVRVVWGGDETVQTIRKIPLPPSARDLVFPDKHSLALISATRYLETGIPDRNELARRFFNDTFSFDQLACSSARLVVWTGPEEDCKSASCDFGDRLSSYIATRNHQADLSTALDKFAYSCAAVIDQDVTGYQRYSNELTILQVDNLNELSRQHCGGGLVFQHFAPDLIAVRDFISRRDQTVSHYGFDKEELVAFAVELNGRGVDRIVPIGQALAFSHIWDGYDLLQEFTRRVHIQAAGN